MTDLTNFQFIMLESFYQAKDTRPTTSQNATVSINVTVYI